MLHLTTNNNERQILVGVPDDAILFKISGTGWLCYNTTKYGQWNVLSQPSDELLIKNTILGTFDKEKMEIDFEYNPSGVGLVSDYDKYMYLLESVTKESEYNKFVVLKQN